MNNGNLPLVGTPSKNTGVKILSDFRNGLGSGVGILLGFQCHHPTFHETCKCSLSSSLAPSSRVASCCSSGVSLNCACNSNVACLSFGLFCEECLVGNVVNIPNTII